MPKDNEKNQLLKKKIQIFFERKTPIHISLSKGTFLNGIVKEISSDFFILDERMHGEMPVFFLEIYDVEKMEVKNLGGLF